MQCLNRAYTYNQNNWTTGIIPTNTYKHIISALVNVYTSWKNTLWMKKRKLNIHINEKDNIKKNIVFTKKYEINDSSTVSRGVLLIIWYFSIQREYKILKPKKPHQINKTIFRIVFMKSDDIEIYLFSNSCWKYAHIIRNIVFELYKSFTWNSNKLTF